MRTQKGVGGFLRIYSCGKHFDNRVHYYNYVAFLVSDMLYCYLNTFSIRLLCTNILASLFIFGNVALVKFSSTVCIYWSKLTIART
jgi:hypothetical protein